jgi:hypothetical protein
VELGLQVADIEGGGAGEAIEGVGVEGQGAVGELLDGVAEVTAKAEQREFHLECL